MTNSLPSLLPTSSTALSSRANSDVAAAVATPTDHHHHHHVDTKAVFQQPQQSAKKIAAVEEKNEEEDCSDGCSVSSFSVAKTTTTTTIQPYKHQVGGHESLLSLGGAHICKPRHEAEYYFYTHMPGALVPYTPALCMEAEVVSNDNSDNSDDVLVRLGGRVPLHSSTTQTHQSTTCKCGNGYCQSERRGVFLRNYQPVGRQHPRVVKEFSPFFSEQLGAAKEMEEDQVQFRDVSSGLATPVNPWVFHCQLRKKSRMRGGQMNNRYLIFEDITSRFHRPCILDVKLGTRQYGDAASTEKSRRQKWKCKQSTSKEMGMRICGLQYFDTASQTYQCVDKYVGRSLSKKGVHKLLTKFFLPPSTTNNFINLITPSEGGGGGAVCQAILKQLREIIRVISSLNGYRFFGTSLLVVYEGDQCQYGRAGEPDTSAGVPHSDVDVRLIDFANVTTSSHHHHHHYSSPPTPLAGATTASELASQSKNHIDRGGEEGVTKMAESTSSLRQNDDDDGGGGGGEGSTNENERGEKIMGESAGGGKEGDFDSSSSGSGSGIYSGPDTGCLLGLRSLEGILLQCCCISTTITTASTR